MPKCPSCHRTVADIDDLEQDVFRAQNGGTTMWSCPDCESILGISDWDE